MNTEYPVNSIKNSSAQIGADRGPKQRKFEDLLSATGQLNDIENQLYELHQQIGINPAPCNVENSETKECEATLLNTLDNLPGRVRNKINGIGELIREISEALG